MQRCPHHFDDSYLLPAYAVAKIETFFSLKPAQDCFSPCIFRFLCVWRRLFPAVKQPIFGLGEVTEKKRSDAERYRCDVTFS